MQCNTITHIQYSLIPVANKKKEWGFRIALWSVRTWFVTYFVACALDHLPCCSIYFRSELPQPLEDRRFSITCGPSTALVPARLDPPPIGARRESILFQDEIQISYISHTVILCKAFLLLTEPLPIILVLLLITVIAMSPTTRILMPRKARPDICCPFSYELVYRITCLLGWTGETRSISGVRASLVNGSQQLLIGLLSVFRTMDLSHNPGAEGVS